MVVGAAWVLVRPVLGAPGDPLVEVHPLAMISLMLLLYLGGTVGLGRRLGWTPAILFLTLAILNLYSLASKIVPEVA